MKILSQLGINPFQALPLVKGGKAQTIFAAYWPQINNYPADEHITVSLDDGDQLMIALNKPKAWTSPKPIAVLVHGLTGCEQSKYLIRISRHLVNQGFLAARVNLRGCGPGFGLAKLPYHSGRSEDVLAVIDKLSELHPNSPIDLIGFSLGANISLKLAGENPEHRSLRRVVAVSPPLNLAASTKKLMRRSNQVFNWFFVKRLLHELQRQKNVFPDLKLDHLSGRMSLAEFDDLYTAPTSGFKNAADYYEQCSSRNFIRKIKIPTLLLYSNDDPVIDETEFEKLVPQKNLNRVILDQGGHVGFLGKTNSKYGVHWMDQLVVEWLLQKHS